MVGRGGGFEGDGWCYESWKSHQGTPDLELLGLVLLWSPVDQMLRCLPVTGGTKPQETSGPGSGLSAVCLWAQPVNSGLVIFLTSNSHI